MADENPTQPEPTEAAQTDAAGVDEPGAPPDPVPPAADPAPSADPAPAPADPPAPAFDIDALLADPDARARLEEHPEFKKREADRVNTQAQRQITRLNRDAADRAAIVEANKRVLADAGLTSLDPQVEAQLGIIADLNEKHQWQKVADAFPTAILPNYKIAREDLVAAQEAFHQPFDEGGGWPGYVHGLIEGAAKVRIQDSHLKDVPEGSALHKDIQAEVARRLESELSASEQENQRARTNGVPTPPAGTVTGHYTRAELIEFGRADHRRLRNDKKYIDSYEAMMENKI